MAYEKMVDPIVFTEYPNKGIVTWDTLDKVLQVNWSFLDMRNTPLMV
jgi:hypothetical protein